MAPVSRLLILGGTGEARLLANQLVSRHGLRLTVMTSLAGRTTAARLPKGEIRQGGFGGVEGLVSYLKDARVDAMIDATHPFAAQISRHAAAAAQASGVPLVHLVRPDWPIPDGLILHRVPDMTAAAAIIEALGVSPVFVTVGQRDLERLAGLTGIRFVIRQIEAHTSPLPIENAKRVVQRPPYDLAHERALIEQYAIRALLTKDSGGDATVAKLQAARDAAIPVVMIDRPDLPNGQTVGSVDDAMAWIEDALGMPDER